MRSGANKTVVRTAEKSRSSSTSSASVAKHLQKHPAASTPREDTRNTLAPPPPYKSLETETYSPSSSSQSSDEDTRNTLPPPPYEPLETETYSPSSSSQSSDELKAIGEKNEIEKYFAEAKSNLIIGATSFHISEICTQFEGTIDTESVYYSKEFDNVPIESYLAKLVNTFSIPDDTLIGMLIYLTHYLKNGEDLHFSNAHGLILTCLLIANKYSIDVPYNNKAYAKVGKMSCKDLNKMEVDFVTKFNVYVTKDEFEGAQAYLNLLMATSSTANEIEPNAILEDQRSPSPMRR